MANSVRIGGARVDISGQDAEFQRVMRRAGRAFDKQEKQIRKLRRTAKLYNNTVGRLTKGIAGLAAGAGFAALAQATSAAARESAGYGASLVEVSARIGTTVEDLQTLRRVFEGDGVAAEKFDQIMSALVRRFSADSPALQRAIQKVGISLDDWYATGGDVAKLLPLLAQGMAQSTSQADRLNLAQEAFSSAGRAAAVILQQGAEALAANSEAMRSLGIVTTEEAKRLKDFDQALADLRTGELTKQAKAVANNTDAFLKHAEAVSTLKQGFSDFIVAIAPLTQKIGQIFQDMAADIDYVGSVTGAVAKFLKADVLDIVSAWRTMREEVDAAAATYEAAVKRIYGAGGPKPPAPTRPPETVDADEYTKVVVDAKRRRETPRTRAGSVASADEAAARQLEIYDNLAIAADKARQASVEAARAADQEWRRVASTFEGAATKLFADFIAGTASAGDAFRSFASTVIQELIRIQAAKAAAGLIGLFAGAGNAPISAPGGGPPAPPGLARGGTIRSAGIVDVHRNERIFLPANATVYPKGQMPMGMGRGGDIINVTINTTAGPAVRAEVENAMSAVRASWLRESRDNVLRDMGRPSPLFRGVRA